MRLRSAIALVWLVLGPAVLSAQTVASISGTFEDESTLSITGSGFGSKAHAAPLRWTDFNGGTAGELLNEPGWNMSYDPDTWCSPSYTTENMRDNTPSAIFCGERSSDGYLYQVLTTGHLNPAGTKLYISGSMWFDWGNVPRSAPTDVVQIKTWRIFTTGGTSWEVEPGLLQESTYQNNNYAVRIEYRESPNGCPELSYSEMNLNHPPYNNQNWNSFQIVLEMGDLNAANGKMLYYQNCVLAGDRFENYNFRCGDNGLFDNFMIGNYLGNAPSGLGYENRTQYDDIYIDDTWQRVEIGDAPTYSACTHREMQIPTAWSDGNISVVANMGSFSPSDTAYLFVVDENNQASAGYEIQWGGVVEATNPGPPGQPVSTQ